MYDRKGSTVLFPLEAPVPHSETPEYARFLNYFLPWSIMTSISLTYALILLLPFSSHEFFSWLFEGVEFTAERIAFLDAHDNFSAYAYKVTLFMGLMSALMSFLVIVYGYWKTVFSPRRCQKISTSSIFSIIFMAIIFGAFFWICFLSTAEISSQRPIGFAKILFWPFFPTLGATFLVLASGGVFSIVMGTLKLILLAGGKDGRFT